MKVAAFGRVFREALERDPRVVLDGEFTVIDDAKGRFLVRRRS